MSSAFSDTLVVSNRSGQEKGFKTYHRRVVDEGNDAPADAHEYELHPLTRILARSEGLIIDSLQTRASMLRTLSLRRTLTSTLQHMASICS